ncbi:MAG: hypothetical protein CM1200mP29_14340 [Verrucomicrobiota bacterium]|nr:MAG: hypothetical protein CM1200mP29_14340 [Verrucomicrobiota bacterium]
MQDIVEQKGAELELRRSELLFHSLVENLPQYIFRKDAAGRFTFANNRFCKELGKRRREIIGKTDFDFFPADLANKYREDDIGIMESGESLDTVEEHVVSEVEKSWVHVVKTPIRDETGRCTGYRESFGMSPSRGSPRPHWLTSATCCARCSIASRTGFILRIATAGS